VAGQRLVGSLGERTAPGRILTGHQVIEQPAHVLHSGRTVDSSAHGLRVDYAEISSWPATTSLVLGACLAMITLALRSCLSPPQHRSQPRFEAAVIALDAVVGVLIGAVPGGWQQLLQQRGLLAAEQAAQLAEHHDEPLGVVAGLQVKAELGAAATGAITQRGGWGAAPSSPFGSAAAPTRAPMMAHPGQPLDHLRDALQGPQLALEAVGSGALKQGAAVPPVGGQLSPAQPARAAGARCHMLGGTGPNCRLVTGNLPGALARSRQH
jgi:hypothetical protein